MLSATETSSHPAVNIPLPRQSGGANPIACRTPSSRSQRAASALPAAASCSGDVTSISSTSASVGSLRAVRRVSDSARPAPESTISAPSSWAEPRHREGQRRVGQHAGDQEPLAVEESHCATEVMRR